MDTVYKFFHRYSHTEFGTAFTPLFTAVDTYGIFEYYESDSRREEGFVVDDSLTGDNVKGVKHCLGVNDLDLVR